MIEKVVVASSAIDTIGYDSKNEELYIKYNKGGLYKYTNVKRNVFDELKNAKSHGHYNYYNIRLEYNYERIY